MPLERDLRERGAARFRKGLWCCFRMPAVTASNAGSQLDESKFARSAVMIHSSLVSASFNSQVREGSYPPTRAPTRSSMWIDPHDVYHIVDRSTRGQYRDTTWRLRLHLWVLQLRSEGPMATLKMPVRCGGVSRSTASYVYNNPERVGRTTRSRVSEKRRVSLALRVLILCDDCCAPERSPRSGDRTRSLQHGGHVYHTSRASWRASRKFATSSAPISPLFRAH